MAAVQKDKKRYQLVTADDEPDGAVFVPNVSEDTLKAKVKAGEWKARPDLDRKAEKELADRDKAAKVAAEKAAKEAAEKAAADASKS